MDKKHPDTELSKIKEAVEKRIMAEKDKATDKPLSSKFSDSKIRQCLNAGEDGDAWLFTELHRNHFCYDPIEAEWYEFNEHYWRHDIVEQVIAQVDAIIEIYWERARTYSEKKRLAEKSGDSETADKHKAAENSLLKRIRALHNFYRKNNVLRLARAGKNSLCIKGTEWDRNNGLLGLLNGVFDINTETFRPGQPDDFTRQVIPIQWEGFDSPRKLFDQFILDICNGDDSLVDYLQTLFGYAMTGEVLLHIFIIFYGKGRNGKGTLLEILKSVLGPLAYKTNFDFLIDSRFNSNGPTPELIALRGKRIVWASETKEGHVLNVSKLKEVVGGDTLNARAPYAKKQVEFSPSHTLILLTNNRPHATASDYALWQRIHLVPFEASFVADPKNKCERKADPELLKKLKKEKPGILAWLIEGTLKFKRNGLNTPNVVREATRAYHHEEDVIGRFIEARCVTDAFLETKAGELYQAYEEWCDETGEFKFNKVRFGRELKNRFDSYTNRFVFYVGVSLK